jgi:hypothetical protein
MKYAVEMGSGVMINIPSFMKIGSGIQKDHATFIFRVEEYAMQKTSMKQIASRAQDYSSIIQRLKLGSLRCT